MKGMFVVSLLVSAYCSSFILLTFGSEQSTQQEENNYCNNTICTYNPSADFADCKRQALVQIPPQCSSAVYLDMRKNDLQFLDKTSLDGFLQLTNLYLDGNQIRNITPGAFAHCTSLQQIFLQNNPIVIIRSGVFAGLRNLRQLYLNIVELQEIEPGAFDGLMSLKRLYLSDNSLSSIPSNLFHDLANLQILTLANNHLQTLATDTFQGLHQLEYLDIKFNRLTTIPEGLFSGLFRLERLTLSFNLIKNVEKGAIDLSELKNLETLDFRNNSISTMPNFDTKFPKSLKLFFAGNPVYCDCHMEWLQNWYKLNQNSSVVQDSGAKVICQGPPSLANHPMQNITHIQLRCDTTDTPYTTFHAQTQTVFLDTEDFDFAHGDNHTQIGQNKHITSKIVILPYVGITLIVLSAIVITVVLLCACWHCQVSKDAEISDGYKEKNAPFSPAVHLTINPQLDVAGDDYEAVTPNQNKESHLVDCTEGNLYPAQNSNPFFMHSISIPIATKQAENQLTHSPSQPSNINTFLSYQQSPFAVPQTSQVKICDS